MDHSQPECQLERRPGPYPTVLKSDEQEIRLFTLLPGAWDSPICGELHNDRLTNGPEYAALSYVWGDASDTAAISLNGHTHAATRNLQIALRHLREIYGRLVMWVDALCINQSDDTEKSAQVSMMGEVYSRAQNVIVWAGEATESSDAMMTALDGNEFDHISETIYHKWRSTIWDFEERPWFTRVWVLQEIVLAPRDAVLVCGLKFTSWSSFATTWIELDRLYFQELGFDVLEADQSELAIGAVPKIDRLKQEYARRSFTFENLAKFTRDLEASDQRDCVYALRALLREEERQLLQVDYTKATWKVFAQAMRLVLQGTDNTIQFPSWLNFHSDAALIEGLPTWVHDFANSAKSYKHGNNARSATRAWPAETMRGADGERYLGHGEFSSDMRFLSIKCLLIDTVTDILAFGKKADVFLHQLADADPFLSAAIEKARDPDATMPGLKQYAFREPLWRVICSDRDVIGPVPAPDSFGAFFEMLSHSENGRSLRERLVEERELQSYKCILDVFVQRRTLLTTARGLYGMGGPGVEAGDVLCIAFGARYMLILRPPAFHDGTHYRLIGAAYIAGIMDGEIIRDYYETGLMEAQTVTIE